MMVGEAVALVAGVGVVDMVVPAHTIVRATTTAHILDHHTQVEEVDHPIPVVAAVAEEVGVVILTLKTIEEAAAVILVEDSGVDPTIALVPTDSLMSHRQIRLVVAVGPTTTRMKKSPLRRLLGARLRLEAPQDRS